MLDEATGAVQVVVVTERRKHAGGFVLLSQEGALQLARGDWHGLHHRVIWSLLGHLDYDNWIRLSLTDLAAELGAGRPKVSAAVAELTAAGVVHRGPRLGQSYTYRLDPALGFKGRPGSRDRLRRELEERGLSVVDGDRHPRAGERRER